MCVPTDSLGGIFSLQILSHIYCLRLVMLASVSVAICFPIVLLIGICAAIKDSEHIVLWWRFGYVYSFFFFPLKHVRTIYLW